MSSTTVLALCISMLFSGFTIGFGLCSMLSANGRDPEHEHESLSNFKAEILRLTDKWRTACREHPLLSKGGPLTDSALMRISPYTAAELVHLIEERCNRVEVHEKIIAPVPTNG